MGISISYKGKLRDPARVAELVRDLTEKARDAGFRFKTMEELKADGRVTCSGLEGITLYPHPECEPLHFHVDAEGTLVNHTYYTLLHDKKKADMMREALAESMALTREISRKTRKRAIMDDGPREDEKGPRVSAGVVSHEAAPGTDFFREGSRYNWTKTQFAGPKVHVAVCAILRYVKERYAPELEVKDDSGYFADGDYNKLEVELAYVDRLTSLASQAIQAAAASSKGPMSLDAFVRRINEELAEAKNNLH